MKLKFMNYLVRVMLFLSGVMLVIPLLLFGNYQNSVFETKVKPYAGWKSITNKGVMREIETFPVKLDAEPNQPVTIYNRLPKEIESGSILFLHTDNQSVLIQIAGKEVYSYGEKDTASFFGVKSGNWIMIHLKPEMEGKTISIETKSAYEAFTGRFSPVYLASHYEAAMIILLLGLRNNIMTILLILAAVYFFLNSLCLEKRGLLTPYRAISMFCICSATWLFAQGQGMFLLIPNPLFMYLVANISYMISPVFFLIFLRWKETEYERQIRILTSVASISAIVNIVAQISTKFDMWRTIDTTKLVMLVCAIFFLYIHVKKNKYQRHNLLEMATIGVVILMILGMAADIYNFYMHQYMYYGVTTTAAIFGFLICMGIDMINRTKAMSESSHVLVDELKKAEISMLSTQIQPHFIYNCLATISYLCKTDAEKADEATIHLSGYLRHNVNYANENEMIRFMEEVKHVRNYMYLEQIRFPQIVFEEKLDYTEFLIPPLTIQPFVENAVKHGLTRKLDGGTVSLKSYLEKSEIVIEISDNGIGFDRNNIDISCSKGIANVSKRLELVSGAVVRIQSQKDRGTIVEIRIKKEMIRSGKSDSFQEVRNR